MIASSTRSPSWAIGSTDQTVGNILRRYHIAPTPERSRTTTWKEFIRSHMDVLAGTDLFTVEGLTWQGLITYYRPSPGVAGRHHPIPGLVLDGASGAEPPIPVGRGGEDEGGAYPGCSKSAKL
jgi:hypothetical protein